MSMRKKPLVLAVVLILVVGLTGCSTDPASITISGKDGRNGLVITDTNTAELTAVVTNQMNEPVNEDEIVWSVSDPSLATITGEGATATVTGVKAGKVVVTAAYGELKGTFNLYIFETKPAKEIRENFEGFAAGTPAATAGYTFSGNAVIATGEGGQGTNVLKLTKTAENAQLQVDFGQPVTKGSVSLLVKKPAGSGSYNVSLAGAGKRAGFQLTNNNGFRHRNTEGSSSSDTQLGSVDTNNWLRLEIVFDNDAGTYSFYQGEGSSRSLIGGPVPYARGENGITGVEIQHAGTEGQIICVDDIIVTDLTLQNIVF